MTMVTNIGQDYAWKGTWPDGDVAYALGGVGAAELIQDEESDIRITIVSWGDHGAE